MSKHWDYNLSSPHLMETTLIYKHANDCSLSHDLTLREIVNLCLWSATNRTIITL